MSLSASVVDRLVFAKYLFRRGAEESAKGHEVAKAVAVLHFHDCLELFLQCVVDVVGVRDAKGLTFTGYPAKIREAAQKPMIRPSVVDKVNNLRVPLKHQGIRPGSAALKALSAEVEAFLEQNSNEFLAVDFHDVSLGDMISDPALRGQVKAAENAIEDGRYGEALEKLAAAFQTLITDIEPALFPRRMQYGMRLERTLVDRDDIPKLEESEENHRLQRMVQRMNERYDRLVAVIEPLRLGLDVGDYQRFRHLSPRVETSLHETRENAVFCLNFVIDSALRVQGGSPALRDPWSRYTVEVEADSVSVLMFAPEGVIEERRAPKGERFEKVKLTIVAPEGKPGPSGEHWMLGEWDDERRWEAVRFLPLAGVRIVEEHRT